MVDFLTPTNTTLYTNVLGNLNDKISSVGKMSFTGDTNIPVGFVRINGRTIERWNGTSWVLVAMEPAGVIKMYGGTTAPAGHLLCQGQSLARLSYPDLFAAIGTAYGAVDANSFSLPNMQQRFPLGKAAAGTGSVLGSSGGAIDHVHKVFKHFHEHTVPAANTTSLSVDIQHTHEASGVTGSVGGSDGGHTHGVTDLGHTHGIPAKEGGSDGSQANRAQGASSSSGTNRTYTSSSETTGISVNSAGSGHGHGFSLTAGGQTLGSTTKYVSGSVGPSAANGGLDGDLDQDSGTGNPPFVVVNFIITI
jgi:hypothetical protein